MDVKPVNIPLLPYRYKIAGVVLSAIGFVLGIMNFYFGFKPDFLDIHVFAVFSKYFQSNYFSVIENNIIEELTGVCIICGLSIIALSKEKYENDTLNFIRLKSFIYAVYTNTVFLLFSLFFIYGLGFVFIMILNLFSVPLIYIGVFYYLKQKTGKKEKQDLNDAETIQ